MILKKLRIKVYENHITNCYMVFDEDSKETMVIDPAGDVGKIIEYLDILKGKLKYMYISHCHLDHIAGIEELKKKAGGKILIHRDDAEGLNNQEINMSKYVLENKIELEADSRLDDNDLIHIGNLEFKVIHTPGHTAGGTCLYCEKEKLLFSGDTMFKGVHGRTDLPTSNQDEMIKSVARLLMLPENTIVYPGHGKETMIKEEKEVYLN